MKVNMKTIFFLILIICLFKIELIKAQHNKEAAVANALSYLIEEENYLNLIKGKYFKLKDSVDTVKLKFENAFAKSKQELEKLYINDLEDFQTKMIDRSTKYFFDINPTEKQAQEFILRVQDKIKGKIDSPEFELLLGYEYDENPVEEIKAGYTKNFCTQGHLKSNGINFTITLPESWRQMENEKLHSYKKFISKNGFGNESLLITVKDLKIPKNKDMSENELAIFYETEGLQEILPKGCKYVTRQKTTINNHQGEQILYQHTGPHHIKAKYDTYVILIHNKIAIIQFTIQELFGKSSEERFAKLLPLYTTIINSVVFSSDCK